MKRSIPGRSHIYIAATVALAGLLTLAHGHFVRFGNVLGNAGALDAGGLHVSRIVTTLLGGLLLYLSLQLFHRKRRAWRIALAGLAILLTFSLLRLHIYHILVYGGLLTALVACRRTFDVRSDNYNLRRGIYMALGVFGVTLLYGAVGFYFLEKRDFNVDFTALDSLKYSFYQITQQGSGLLTPNTRFARIFLDSLSASGILAVILVAASLFKPIRFILAGRSTELAKARQIIHDHSDSPEDFFKIYPEDKHYFFSEDGKAVVAYAVSRGVAMVIDGPSGAIGSRNKIYSEFDTFAREQGWQPAIIHADQTTLDQAAKSGYSAVYIGSEAMVDVSTFAASTFRSKHFRYIKNKAAKDGLEVEFWQAPLNTEQLATLHTISNAWLTSGRREYRFVMAPFSDDYVGSCDVAVLHRGDDYLAYANLIPEFVPGVRSVDHIRHTASMPSAGMHFLLMQLILRVSEQGIRSFNLGLAPLSGIEDRQKDNLPEKLLAAAKSVGSRYYSFKGLEQFKNKFDPDWQPRFIVYRGTPARLLTASAALNDLVSVPKPATATAFKIVLGLAILAALAYASFPLGYLLGQPSDGFASQLAAESAPYAGLFNGLDIASGIAMAIVAAYLFRLAGNSLRGRVIAVAYGLAGLGGLAAALISLPEGGAVRLVDNLTFLHIIASLVNAVALFLAIAAVSFDRAGKTTKPLLVLFLLYLLAGAAYIAAGDTTAGYVLQRVQIALSGIWIVLIPMLLLKKHNS